MKGNSALSGILFITGSNIIVKVLGIAAQLILATLISRDDFALFALSASIAAVVLGLRNGGTDNLLIQKGRTYASLSSKILTYSLIFNTIAFLTLAVLSIFSSAYYQQPALIIILILNGLSLVIGTLPPVLGAKLSIDCKFKDLALINIKSLTIKHVTTIIFAYVGFGFYAFILPLLLQYISASYLFYKACGTMPALKRLSKKYFGTILHSTKWIMAGNLCFQISNNSQLFIIGTFANSTVLSVFFFCLMLINSPVALINSAISDVIFPKLALMNKDKKQFEDAVLRAMTIGFSLNVATALLAGFFLPLIILACWHGKWDDAVPLISLLVYMIPSLTLIELMNFVLASKGLWKQRTLMLALFVLVETILLAVWVMKFKIIYTCILLVVLKLLFSVIAVAYVFHLCGISKKYYWSFLYKYVLPIAPVIYIAIYNSQAKPIGAFPTYLLLTICTGYYLYQSKYIFMQFFYRLIKRSS